MVSLKLGDYTVGVRWDLGSGLPFSRPMGFDELFSFKEKLPIVKYEYGTPRVILEELYQGRMPTYHRLDISLKRTIDLSSAQLNLQIGAVNLYDQTNIFYYVVYTHRRQGICRCCASFIPLMRTFDLIHRREILNPRL